MQSFCKAKDTIKKTKQQSTGKDLFNPTSDRGIISNVYKELKKLDSRESNNLIKTEGTELNKELSTEEYLMAKKHLKKRSTSLVFRKMEIKTTLRLYLTPVRMTKIKNSGNSKCWQGCGERGTLPSCWLDCKLVQAICKAVWQFLRKI